MLLKKCMISLDYTGCVDFISIQEKIILPAFFKRRSALIVSMLDSGLSGPASYPGRGHCVVFLGKTPDSHSASFHPGVQMGKQNGQKQEDR